VILHLRAWMPQDREIARLPRCGGGARVVAVRCGNGVHALL